MIVPGGDVVWRGGQSIQLKALVIPENSVSYDVTWTMETLEGTDVAELNATTGLVTGRNTGKVKITAEAVAKNGGKTLTATCNVKVFTPVTGVRVSPNILELTPDKIGTTHQLTATVLPENASNKRMTWTSSNTRVATVSQSGLVSILSEGRAVIRVNTEEGSYYASCLVWVAPENQWPKGIERPGTFQEKVMYIFGVDLTGKSIGDWAKFYNNYTDTVTALGSNSAEKDVRVTVKFNNFKDNSSKGKKNEASEKEMKTRSIPIHILLGPEIRLILDEIYADSQKFPIHTPGTDENGKDIGGIWGTEYHANVYSLHNYGLAVDINSAENPYLVKKNLGEVKFNEAIKTHLANTDPYAIHTNDSVYKIFRKYSWFWGGDWTGDTRDYMHFGYFEY
jgi:hypothetical protein